ncbi:MAG: peptide chain release factor 1 [Chloroflexi bacterium]|nr:peptide chain release factor 1 [Chloroflexota bacterium]
MSLEDRLDDIERRLSQLDEEWSDPAVAGDPDRARALGREQARLAPIVDNVRRLRSVRAQLETSRHERDTEQDPEIRELAREVIAELETQETSLVEELRVQLLPRDPNDERGVLLEVRAGAGGDEAALFAAELVRMYLRYAERHRWSTEIMTSSETGIGGIKEAIVEVGGDGAWSRLKYEGGVHRVQRVPETESSGRIHTSTATVAVLPEADEVEVAIDEDKDLRIEVKRSSGPGGQSVNTTDSAVRITHLPTGLVVEIQDEKSQHKNKAKALAVLRARLLEQEQQRAHAEEAAARRTMVGSGDRSEKIRTYNYPQDRVTDHRIRMDVHGLPAVLDGDLDRLLDALIQDDQARLLANLEGTPEP